MQMQQVKTDSISPISREQQNKSQTYYTFCDSRKPKGIALVIHGLNLNPERMESIIRILLNLDIMVLNLSLSGHGENFKLLGGKDDKESRLEALKNIRWDDWLDEAENAYQSVQSEASRLGVPIILVGYSIGGLLGLNMIRKDNAVVPNYTIFFAPAIALRRRGYLVKFLSTFPRMVIPSWSPEFYRSNDGTAVAAYLALYKGVKQFQLKPSTRLNIPTLIIIDRHDELVSTGRLKKLICNRNLDRWQILELENNEAAYHHLIIDEKVAGMENWEKVTERITGLLTGRQFQRNPSLNSPQQI